MKKRFKPKFYIGQPVTVKSYVVPDYIDNQRRLLVYRDGYHFLGIVIGAKLIHLGEYQPEREGYHHDFMLEDPEPARLLVTEAIHVYEVRAGWINRPLLYRDKDIVKLETKDAGELRLPYRHTRYSNRNK